MAAKAQHGATRGNEEGRVRAAQIIERLKLDEKLRFEEETCKCSKLQSSDVQELSEARKYDNTITVLDVSVRYCKIFSVSSNESRFSHELD